MILDQAKEYWQSRSARDRRVIQLLTGVVIIVIVYAYIWMPMNEARARLRAELPKLRGAAAQMNVEAQEVARLKTSTRQTARVSPQETVTQSAEQAGIRGDVSQITPLSPERVQVMLNNVSFDNWIRWTQILATTSGLRIESAQVNAATEPGMVKVQTVLSLSGK
ncbi:MAG: type II secretion system protein M [Pseudomonadota bacterium]